MFDFTNRFIKHFSGDTSQDKSPRTTNNVLYAETLPTPVTAPKVICWSEGTAKLLSDQINRDDNQVLQILSGNLVPPETTTYATRYGGHQFGHWAGQLGDGRAIYLGETQHKDKHWEVQLKGAGATPYSRFGDGRAVLRSSLREFLCSEAMHHLGVPTTRALSCVTTGDLIARDMFYDGNVRNEPGAITSRVASTFLRFGHFEILAASGETEHLKKLMHYVLNNHFPEKHTDFDDGIEAWFSWLCKKTAELIVHWTRTGFVHGVLNTDNMSILGMTIDYGPYGWLDDYNPRWTPNTSDKNGRYCFANQPAIGLWNLERLASSLAPLTQRPLLSHIDTYKSHFEEQLITMMANKIGFEEFKDKEDAHLVEALDEHLLNMNADMTLFYRKLADIHQLTDQAPESYWHVLKDCFYKDHTNSEKQKNLISWVQAYLNQYQKVHQSTDAALLMNKTNPAFLLRNYIAQQVIEEVEQDKTELLEQVIGAYKNPYATNTNTPHLYEKRPDWAMNKAGCSRLSCSS